VVNNAEETMKKIILIISGLMIHLFMILMFQECMAGMVIEEVHKDMEGRASTVLRYFSENKFRTDHPDSGLTTIIDFKEDRMVMIDHSSKSFVEIKFSQWEKEVAKRLKEDLPAIKPKARKIIVKKTGEKATINAFQTEKIEIWADGELIEENWVTRDVEMRDVEKVMDKVAQGFSKQFRLEMKEGREIYEQLKSYGFPILIKDHTITYGLRPIDVLEIKRLEKRELKDDLFLPPSGYQRIIPKAYKK
jgi:hypothetical protein